MNKLEIENIFLNSLGSVHKLQWYLKDNINILNYIYSMSSGQMAIIDLTLAFIPKSKKIRMLKDFNTDRILGILKRQRPDIYNVLINSPNGRDWLGEQINSFRKHFLK